MHGLCITDDGAMPCATDHMVHRRFAFDRDDFGTRVKRLPTLRRFIACGVSCINLLQIQILHIGTSVGEAPGHMGVATQHHKGQTWQAGTDHIGVGCFQMRVIPNGRRTQSKVRIIGQQRLTRGGV